MKAIAQHQLTMMTLRTIWLILILLKDQEIQCATLAESIFIGLSKACRVIMKTHSADRSLADETHKLSIVWHTENGTLKIPIGNAAEQLMTESAMFNDRYMTVITIHGFNDHPKSAIPAAISAAYIKKGKHNVITLDCSQITTGQYPRAAYMSQLIGKTLSNFLTTLTTNFNLEPNKIHLIGISLGAQTAGWTGRFFRSSTAKMIHRITGLDPAGPCFSNTQSGEFLYKDDAVYVDVIHVNKGVQGILETIGHADYFVNGGGPNQPGCSGPNCSHHRAGILYIESLYNDKSLLGRKCKSWEYFMDGRCNHNELSVMGFNTSMKSKGKFYLKTAEEHPYAMGINGATVPKRRTSIFDLFNTFG